MITDARALRPAFVPRELEHRDGQIDYLSTALTPVVDGDRAEDVCIFGPSGAGKTTLAKFTLEKLEKETLGFRWSYANCVAESTRTGVLFTLVREAGLGEDLRREGAHEGTAFDRLRAYDGQLILVIDEVDVLDDPSLLHALWDMAGVALILISAAEDEFLADLNDRQRSRIRTATNLRLEKYTLEELVDILEGRVDHGLIASRVDEAAIEHIADLAAGDARKAIGLLRYAAKHCERSGSTQLTVDVVDEVSDAAVAEVRDRRVADLGTHKRVLYELVQEPGEIDAGTLHARYEDQVSNPRAKSTRRKYLQSLERYGLLEKRGNGRATVYCPAGQ